MARTHLWEAGPGHAEPPSSKDLYDTHGGRWTRDNATNPYARDGRDGWTLVGTGLSFRWTSPALAGLGPFRDTKPLPSNKPGS